MDDSDPTRDPEPPRELSLLEEVKIQAKVLVPLLHGLRQELGRERADELVSVALRNWSKSLFEQIAASVPGAPVERFQTMMQQSVQRIGGDIDVETLEMNEAGWSFNITGCRYADFFRELGEPELGGVLVCESDHHMVDAVGPAVELERTQTIMSGARYCDFRYRFDKASDPE